MVRQSGALNLAPGEWTFQTAAVAAAFDRHVREQLPWYDLATGIVAHVARHFIPARGGVVIDLGASTGNIGAALASTIEARGARLIAVDNSPAMVERYRGPGVAVCANVEDYDFTRHGGVDLVVAFLLLMFVAPAVRRELVERIKAAVRRGGAFVVFDKRTPLGGELGQIMYRLTLAAKYENGAAADEIIRKELALAGVQRPLDPDELDGFVEVFRFGDFSGWVFRA